MKNEIDWQKEAQDIIEKYFNLREALQEIVIAPFDKVEWYKQKAKEALSTNVLSSRDLYTKHIE
jgi:hypothetical protein